MTNNSLRIVVVALLVIFLGLFYYSGQQRDYFQPTAQPAVEKILLEVSSWQAEDMRRHLSSAASQAIDEQQLKLLLDQYRPLGQLLSVDTLEFSRLMSVFSLLGDNRISYSGSARYTHGAAHFTLTLQVSGGQYSIYNLTIQPVQSG